MGEFRMGSFNELVQSFKLFARAATATATGMYNPGLCAYVSEILLYA